VQLETIYTNPGVLLVVTDEAGERLGCVGLRSLGEHDGVLTGEVRRLYVRCVGRGAGLGRALMARLTEHALDAGFGRLVLNTIPTMSEAVSLYESLGYVPIEPYVDEPIAETMYLGLVV
jgi:GNAT superfamily N-acetyltransferase